MISPAQLRIGSLEMLAALVVFGAIVSRLRPAPAAPAYPKALEVELEILDSPGLSRLARRQTVRIGADQPECVIGRQRDVGITLLDPEVSRRHARLTYARGVPYLSDLGSSNGTFLNGKRLNDEGIEVRPGDDVDVGNTRMKIVSTVPVAWT